jgi:hypothetical protein
MEWEVKPGRVQRPGFAHFTGRKGEETRIKGHGQAEKLKFQEKKEIFQRNVFFFFFFEK